MTEPKTLPLGMTDADVQLHACLDLLLMKAAMDHPGFQALAMELMTSDIVLETEQGTPGWAYHIARRSGMGFDARFMMGVILSRLTRKPEILHKLLDVELEALDAEDPDLELMRRMHAAMTGALLRPLLKTALGASPTDQFRLVSESHRVLDNMQDWTKKHIAPPSPSRQAAAKDGTSILLLLSWVPAEPNTGAHLKQLASYTHGLMMAGQAQGRGPVRVKLMLTYDNHTTWLVRNYQAYSKNSAAIIETAVKDALGPELAEQFSVEHILPPHHDSAADWVRHIVKSAEDFNPDAILRWYGFYASNVAVPALHQRFPILGIQFNAKNPVDAYSDILLNQGELAPEKADDPRWREHRTPIEVPPRRLDLTREELDLPAGARTLVSTLSGGRLEKAIQLLPPDARGQLLDLFEKYPDLVWFWVGVADEAGLRALDPRLQSLIETGRIRCLQFSDDLRALYQHCDLYVHLPAMHGGGMGVAMAVEEGKPVLCHAGADPCNFLPGNTIPTSWPGFLAELEQLIASEQTRGTYASQQSDWMRDKHSLAGVGGEVLGYIDEAVALHRAAASSQQTEPTS
ncbi:glycosyltransferase [Pacificoceanicola onchidii]|uniref:glycosyltransferase n=1 Tax=Pacificoceanicola onchidii TaxID=2562685 RepID=UPI0010A69C16|nr:glycosyltransferase [Pacificoceanicola onchidii]